MTDEQIHNMRLTIMTEVNEKLTKANAAFDEIVQALDRDGTEFARQLKSDIEHMREGVKSDIENVWSYMKSKLISIEAGQNMLYNSKDGLLKKALDKVDMAVKMSRDAAECTTGAKEAAETAKGSVEEAKTFIRTNIFVTAATFLGIFITVVTFVVNYSSKITRDTTNQAKMIEALNEKIVQDKQNQKETIEMMKKLYNKLGKAGEK